MRESIPREVGLRTHLVLVFGAISLVAVAVLVTVEGLGIGSALDGLDDVERQRLADQVAAELADAYAAAGTWDGADIEHAASTAEGAGAWLDVVSDDGRVTTDDAAGASGRGDAISVPVVSDGAVVGMSRLSFTSAEAAAHRAHDYLWAWSLLAAGAALSVAVTVGWVIAARLARPLTDLADTADAYAAGDHSVRTSAHSRTTEVRRLAAALNAMSNDVERSERAQREMLEDVAHELRNPLAVLRGRLEEISDGLAEADEPTVHALHAEILRLGRVVEDLSALAEARQPAPTSPRPVDLAAVVQASVTARRADFVSAGITVTVETAPATVDGDMQRLSQVVGNLLDNSIRHCERGDHCHVSLHSQADQTLLTVQDDGPGIDADDLPRVFDRRYRGRSAHSAGSGIGLAVVQEIVRTHHGVVEITSEAGAGTRVEIRLPCRADSTLPGVRSGHAGRVELTAR
jgi:two-component system sensor histidine kinase BaeS